MFDIMALQNLLGEYKDQQLLATCYKTQHLNQLILS